MSPRRAQWRVAAGKIACHRALLRLATFGRSAVCSTLAIDLQWQVHARRLKVRHAHICALLAQTRLLSDNL
jgi:hypothetical protein